MGFNPLRLLVNEWLFEMSRIYWVQSDYGSKLYLDTFKGNHGRTIENCLNVAANRNTTHDVECLLTKTIFSSGIFNH